MAYQQIQVKHKTPLIIIANYTFDCIKQDAFEIKNKQLHELTVEIRSRYKHFNVEKSQHLGDLRFEYQIEPISAEKFYDNAILSQMLKNYYEQFQDKEVLLMIPVGAIQFIENMNALTKGNFFMIAGDKGIAIRENLPLLKLQQRMTYDGCYSCNINFDAIGEYITKLGGDSLLSKNSSDFNVNIFSMGTKFENLHLTRAYFKSNLEVSGPDEYCFIYVDFFSSCYRFALKSIISFLRYSRWDPDAYLAIHDRLVELIPGAEERLALNIQADLEKVENNVYIMNIGEDVYNALGLFYQKRKK